MTEYQKTYIELKNSLLRPMKVQTMSALYIPSRKNLSRVRISRLRTVSYTHLDVYKRQLADHPEFQNWIDWLERDIQDWTQRREVAHHLRAYGGMGSFNDLPSMRGNHDYIVGFLKSVCYAFGHLYGKREGIRCV